jgi:hypothetical protein
MKTVINLVLSFLVLAYLLINYVEAAQAADKTLDTSNLTILGLIIGDSASQDIYSKFGPGIAFKDTAEADETQVCYVSDKDETLILFSFENFQFSRIRLLSQKKKFYKWHFCEKTPLVSRHLATASGIKLGMSKNGLKAILGAPHSESDENMSDAYEWKQKMNKPANREAGQHSKGVKKNPCRTVRATIRIEFSDTGLISFEVSRYSQY